MKFNKIKMQPERFARNDPPKVYVPREGIDTQSLAALGDKKLIAILMNADDLEMFIGALEYPSGHKDRKRWRKDLMALRSAAFESTEPT